MIQGIWNLSISRMKNTRVFAPGMKERRYKIGKGFSSTGNILFLINKLFIMQFFIYFCVPKILIIEFF